MPSANPPMAGAIYTDGNGALPPSRFASIARADRASITRCPPELCCRLAASWSPWTSSPPGVLRCRRCTLAWGGSTWLIQPPPLVLFRPPPGLQPHRRSFSLRPRAHPGACRAREGFGRCVDFLLPLTGLARPSRQLTEIASRAALGEWETTEDLSDICCADVRTSSLSRLSLGCSLTLALRPSFLPATLHSLLARPPCPTDLQEGHQGSSRRSFLDRRWRVRLVRHRPRSSRLLSEGQDVRRKLGFVSPIFALSFRSKVSTDLAPRRSVANNTPVFFLRDPLKFPVFIHTQKRNPRTNLKDASASLSDHVLCRF